MNGKGPAGRTWKVTDGNVHAMAEKKFTKELDRGQDWGRKAPNSSGIIDLLAHSLQGNHVRKASIM